MTEEKKARLRTNWSVTLNLALPVWEAVIKADRMTSAAENARKITMLRDYIRKDATRYVGRSL